MPQYTLRDVRCREDDARLIFQWRNDPVTREGSFHTGKRDWEEFWPGFCESFPAAGSPLPQFVLCDGSPAAFLRFDPPRPGAGHDDLVEVSINVAPEVRGRGIGVSALHLAEEYLRHFGHDAILALVKADNAVSRHVFEKAGYEATGEVSITPAGEQVPTLAIRYVRQLGAGTGAAV